MKTLLVVDDERDIRRSLKTALEADGYAVREAADAAEADRLLETALPDLVLLDARMPGESGFDFCRRLRAHPARRALPVIFLTSKGKEADRVLGLELGADDYVAKPFSVAELLARVKAVLRRRSGEMENEILSDGPVVLNISGRSVKADGAPVGLTPKQFEVLRLLMQKKGRVLTRQYLMETVWGQDYQQTTRTVDQHVYKLRKALGRAGERILSVGTSGYKWKED